MPSEVEFIKRNIRSNLEDLHIIMSMDAVSYDNNLYNSVTLALLNAESAIEEAEAVYAKAMKAHQEKYGEPNISVD